MRKKIIGGVMVVLLAIMVVLSIYQQGQIKKYEEQANVIDNQNITVEYSENSDGTYEVYVDLKGDQKISEAPVSENLDSVLIAPDQNN